MFITDGHKTHSTRTELSLLLHFPMSQNHPLLLTTESISSQNTSLVSVFYLCIASLPYFHSITGNFLLLLTTVSRRRIYPLAPQCLMDAFYYCYHSLLFPFSDSHHRYGKIRRLCDQILVICPFCLLELLSNTNMALKTKKITGD